MATFKIRFLTTRPGKRGASRYFWQPSADLKAVGFPVRRLPDELENAIKQAQLYNADVDEWRAASGGAVQQETAGSLRGLMSRYRKSRAWRELAPKTRTGYNHCMTVLDRWAGDAPLAAITPQLVQKFYSAHLKTPAMAAAAVRVLRLLMQFGIREGLVKSNPAIRPGIKTRAKKGILWSPEAVRHMARTADDMGLFSIGTAIILNEWMGQRGGDIRAMTMAAYQGGTIRITQSKTGAYAELPIDMVPHLKTRIEAQIARNLASDTPCLILLPGPNNKPWNEYWFVRQVSHIRAEAAKTMPECKQLIFRNLRHTAITRLAEVGCELPQIASVTGHSLRQCADIIDRYNVRTRRMAEGAFALRLAATNT
jgi:integrase